ncbi:hypothetical protein NP493_478g00012, partial [Ridgeia piscesae]
PIKKNDQFLQSLPGGVKSDGRNEPTGGAVYVRWGRKTCPGNATLLYSGVAGGTFYSTKGGGTNYQCLPWEPEWGKHTDGLTSGAYMHGAEYDVNTASSPFRKTNFAGNLYQYSVPCAVCHVTDRQVKVMIPAKKQCPTGWTREYHGYLCTGGDIYHQSTFECVDEEPEVIEGTPGNENGALFFNVEAACGHSLPCPKYVHGWALTCVVCTK